MWGRYAHVVKRMDQESESEGCVARECARNKFKSRSSKRVIHQL